MKTTKKMSLKIIISILTILLFTNFILPTYSNAATASHFGGVLMDPISDLVCTIGDAVINILQKCMTGDWEHFNLSGGLLVKPSEYTSEEVKNGNGEVKESKYSKNVTPSEEFNKTLITGKMQDYYIPILKYSPEEIFAGRVPGLDVNFINPQKTEHEEIHTASILQPTIASWYIALRNLSIVGLLSVLVYVGIRMVISSTAADKAKYKQMLMDWVIALCILFFMHYIMSFTVTITQSICDALSGGNGTDSVMIQDNTSGKTINTNLMGMARFLTQYDDVGAKVTYLIMYIGMVIYTFIFTWFYLKRLLKMAFLTLIAPLVALTYPIDKMGDSKAQAFNSWLKEYIFNALIQPFHLIIYTVFIGSAMDLAANNPIYALAAMGFILPAEKILRGFFGFNNSGTLGGLESIAVGSALGKMLGGGSKGGGGKSSSGGKEMPTADKPVRFDGGQDLSQIEGGDGENPSLPPPSTGAYGNGADEEQNNVNDNRINPFADDESYDYYNNSNAGLGGEQSIDDRMAAIKNEDYDYASNPEWMRLNEQREQEQARRAQEQQAQAQEEAERAQQENIRRSLQQQEEEQEKSKNRTKLGNWAAHHGINKESIYAGTKKAIGGAARFATKKTFKVAGGVAAGIIPAGVALATGGGLKGAGIAFSIAAKQGARVGENAGNIVANIGGKAYDGAERLGRATVKYAGRDKEAFKDELLGGTALGREIDYANDNNRYQKAGKERNNWTSKENRDYIKDKWISNNGGIAPNKAEIDAEMEKLMPYLSKNLNAKEAYKALKLENYGIDTKDAAIMAAYSKESGITADKLNDKKFVDALTRNISKSLEDKGISKEASDNKAQYIVNGMKIYNGVAHNSTPQNNNTSTNNPPPRTANTTQNTGTTRRNGTTGGSTSRGRRTNN